MYWNFRYRISGQNQWPKHLIGDFPMARFECVPCLFCAHNEDKLQQLNASALWILALDLQNSFFNFISNDMVSWIYNRLVCGFLLMRSVKKTFVAPNTCVCVTTATPAMISVLYGTCFLLPFEANLWLSEWTVSEDLGTCEREKKKEKVMTRKDWEGFQRQNWGSSKTLKMQRNEKTEGKKKWMRHRWINHRLWDSQDNSTTAYCVALQIHQPTLQECLAYRQSTSCHCMWKCDILVIQGEWKRVEERQRHSRVRVCLYMCKWCDVCEGLLNRRWLRGEGRSNNTTSH